MTHDAHMHLAVLHDDFGQIVPHGDRGDLFHGLGIEDRRRGFR